MSLPCTVPALCPCCADTAVALHCAASVRLLLDSSERFFLALGVWCGQRKRGPGKLQVAWMMAGAPPLLSGNFVIAASLASVWGVWCLSAPDSVTETPQAVTKRSFHPNAPPRVLRCFTAEVATAPAHPPPFHLCAAAPLIRPPPARPLDCMLARTQTPQPPQPPETPQLSEPPATPRPPSPHDSPHSGVSARPPPHPGEFDGWQDLLICKPFAKFVAAPHPIGGCNSSGHK